jgi:hypothetical protein
MTAMRAWLLAMVACSSAAPVPQKPPPPTSPDAASGGSGATTVRREHKPFSLFIYGLEVGPLIGADTTKLAVDLTDELRKRAREDGLITLGAEHRELLDEKVLNDCVAMTGQCRHDMATRMHVDHILYGGITSDATHAVHLVLYEATSDIAIEWSGTFTDASELPRVAKTAFDSLISRSP